jgi:hypothetical protein
MTRKMKEAKMEALFQVGLKTMRKVLRIQDKLYEFDELYGEKFNEAISDESFLRS